MKYFLLILSLTLYIGCTKPPDIVTLDSCLSKVLIENGMVPYAENEQFCWSLYQYEFEGNEYFAVDCCVCDMLHDPFDCNGEFFARTDGEWDDEKFELFFRSAKNLGLVGIRIQ
jgi:hypothetical protein